MVYSPHRSSLSVLTKPTIPSQGAAIPSRPGAAQKSYHLLEAECGQRHAFCLVVVAVEPHFGVPAAVISGLAAVVGAAQGEDGVPGVHVFRVSFVVGAPVLAARARALPASYGIALPVDPVAKALPVSITGTSRAQVLCWGLDSPSVLLKGVPWAGAG